MTSPLRSLFFLDPTRAIMDATMSNIQKVGHSFLSGGDSLKKVDLSGLCNVEMLNDFLYQCLSLEEIDLSPLSNVQKVGGGFLSGCSSLKKVDLSGLRNLQEMGHNFFRDCFSLKEIDFSALCNVQVVGWPTLNGCWSLTRVILPVSPPEGLRRAVEEVLGLLRSTAVQWTR